MHIIKIIMGITLMASILSAGTDLKPGDPAPYFELKDGNGILHKLSDYKGKKLVLYFYPKDNTSGCTAEACNLRDNYSQLVDSGLVILGVSYDDSVSHQDFSKKYNLPFPLLSDTKKEVAEKYNAKRDLLGFFTPKRITYLIDEKGKILHIFDDVDTKNHTDQILGVLSESKQ
jgi:thioredoxin-dependent peroxiredoxin